MMARVCASAMLFALLFAVGCSRQDAVTHPDTGFSGSVQGKMITYGCPTCHVIPGVPGAVGKVGPALGALSQRSYLAGRLANNSSNLESWLQHPQRIEPGVAMPEMGVTATDAHEMAAYLEQLQ